jgi:hypothetical protein
MLQHVKRKWLHVEPEHQKLGGNDVLELENSNCLINYAVEFEKISDPENKERNGYFMLKQNKYDGWSGSSWNDPRYWRFHSWPVVDWWLRLELDISPSTIYTRVKTNSTKLANEYLFVVLEEEVNDTTRCDEGTKPKVTIISKHQRFSDKMFITWKNQYLVPWATIADYTQWYIHDCQDIASCPGCHSSTHKPTQTNTVENRKCNGLNVNVTGTTWDWYHDGWNVNNKIEFLPDHKVKWSDGKAQGSWSQNGDILAITFRGGGGGGDGVYHKFKLLSKNEATLLEPKRNPPTKITLQDADTDTDSDTDTDTDI